MSDNTINHFAVFFNNNLDYCSNTLKEMSAVESVLGIVGILGNFCFTPVRYLCDGNYVYISTDKKKIFAYDRKDFPSNKRNLLKLIASIVLIVPGILLGTFFKGATYLSPKFRELHNNVITHYTPVNYTIGAPDKRLNLKEIEQQLGDIYRKILKADQRQPIGEVSIFAEKGISFDQIDIIFDQDISDLQIKNLPPPKKMLIIHPNGPQRFHLACNS